MPNVVQLFREPEVWQCLCGSVSFMLYSDGNVECIECEQVSTEQKCFWTDIDA